jgi:hypothetical protein
MPLTASQKRRAEAVKFFHKHAGYGVRPGFAESSERLRNARQLAAAEAHARAEGWRIAWEIDPDVTSADWIERGVEGGPGREPWATWCAALVDENNQVQETLGGVDLGRDGHPDSDPYARVVAAELALDHWQDQERASERAAGRADA